MIVRSMFSMAGLNAVKAVVSIVVSLVVASNVTPAQFGLIAFAMPLMTFITLFTDLGLTSAIVRHGQLTEAEAGAAIGLMIATGLGGATLLLSISWWIETALTLPGIAHVLIGFSFVTFFSIVASGPRALLERGLRYPAIASVEIIAIVFGLITFGICISVSFGVISMVAYHIVFQAVRASAFYILSKPLFFLNWQISKISPVIRVGGWLLLTNLVSYSARNLDNLLIGSILGAASLGIYGIAYQFMTIPLVLLSWPISGVLLATLGRMKGALAHRKADVICSVLTATAAITFPAMCFVSVEGKFVFDSLFSARWDGLYEIVALLAPVGALQSISVYNGAVLIEKGSVKLNFFFNLLGGFCLSFVFVTTIWWGLKIFVVAYIVASLFMTCLGAILMCREAGISSSKFMFCLLPGTFAAVTAVFTALVTVGASSSSLAEFILATLIYVVSAAFALLLFRRRLIASAKLLTSLGQELAILNKASLAAG